MGVLDYCLLVREWSVGGTFYPQNDPFKLIYSPVLVFIHNIINVLSRVIRVRP